MTATETCPRCGGTNLFTVLCTPPSPHYARTGCSDCRRHLRFEPAPMDFARAAAFVLPIGKHKGRAVGDVGADPAGLRYLDWLAAQDWLGASIRRALECYLGDPSVGKDLNHDGGV